VAFETRRASRMNRRTRTRSRPPTTHTASCRHPTAARWACGTVWGSTIV